LEELFTPLGPNIEIATSLPPAAALGPIDSSLVAWRYNGAGIASPNPPEGYTARRTNRGTPSLGIAAKPPQAQFSGRLDIQALSRGLTNGQSRATDGSPRGGDHVDIDLSPRLKARVPLSLSDEEARTGTPRLAMLRAAVDAVEDPAGRSDLDVRLADTLAAWNAFRHFYPYWTEAKVDWDGLLAAHIANAYSAGSREAQWRGLQLLVADARDGHGMVRDPGRSLQGDLAVQLRIIEGQLVVTASA